MFDAAAARAKNQELSKFAFPEAIEEVPRSSADATLISTGSVITRMGSDVDVPVWQPGEEN